MGKYARKQVESYIWYELEIMRRFSELGVHIIF